MLDRRNIDLWFLFGLAILAIVVIIDPRAIYQVKQKTEIPAPQAPKAQTFRFDEPPCPDGLKVAYVQSVRLPRSRVCQQAVGE